MRSLKFVVPFVLFLVLAGFFAVGLQRDPREIPSPFIDKPAPAFKLEQLHDAAKPFTPEDMKGRVWMLNVWASWCVSCRVEHPLLVEMSKRNIVPIVGLNYKDQRDAGMQWLTRFGNPYVLSAYDFDGRVGIDYGVYGVPETFVIDKMGVVRYKQIGPITPEALEGKILPLLKKLQA
ncbi:Thiol:disulfide interchange protein DsbE [Usitatibacter rugosus]|uniref:Thiol:disulfide interchange protein DsbE n=1 Tax=Usitatibacter rugosus TaxID=2732067 RepID=A0A6M4GU95_9PROT|nr:DsbE family thiol:disulfide interchange protein [Usitatibacter rugosus]QJR10909.1 Thiol:disulfide interchange protein DsbE [Usitatibacter rugosus]